jgi:putative Mg2+ transporter-C (MgtC) family protein
MTMSVAAALWQELLGGLPDNGEMGRILVRLLVAILLGGLLGWQRAHVGKVAGMRTHMLVTLGATIVVLLPQLAGMSGADMSRIIQGTLTGVGFIGGGVILKMSDKHQIVGITTAASIWLTATLGVVTGAGRLGLALAGGLLAFAVLTVFGRLERELIPEHFASTSKPADEPSDPIDE